MRVVREGRLDAGAEGLAQARLHDLFEVVDEVAPVEDVRGRAERLLAVHPLRAADALQLGAALVWARERTTGLGFVSLDGRLREAARREGFTVLPTGSGGPAY
jgi:predicted nucleic acid-binding protein